MFQRDTIVRWVHFGSIFCSHIGARRVALPSVNYRRRSVSKSNLYRQFVSPVCNCHNENVILWPHVNYQAKMWLRPTTINTAAFANLIVACIEYPCNLEFPWRSLILFPDISQYFGEITVIPRRLNCRNWFAAPKSRRLSFEDLIYHHFDWVFFKRTYCPYWFLE